jgi:hypothetical protein
MGMVMRLIQAEQETQEVNIKIFKIKVYIVKPLFNEKYLMKKWFDYQINCDIITQC